MKTQFKMRAKVWIYPGIAGWHFITLPKKYSEAIKEKYKKFKRAWGSVPVTVTVGKTSWKTALFPDKKVGAYLLPLKVEVRKKEAIKAGDTSLFILQI